MLSIYVCPRISSLSSSETIKLDINDEKLDDNKLSVVYLMTAIKDKLNLTGEIDDYQLVCLGKKMQKDKLLKHYRIKNNSVVHLFLKSVEQRSADKKFADEHGAAKKARYSVIETHNILVTMKKALKLEAFRDMLDRFAENKEDQDNLIKSVPSLKDDHVAIAILHEPQLLIKMLEIDRYKKLVEKHPVLLEAISSLTNAFLDEFSTSGRNPLPVLSDGLSPSNSAEDFADADDEDEGDDDDDDGEASGGIDAHGQNAARPTTLDAFASFVRREMTVRREILRPSPSSGSSQQSSQEYSDSQDLSPGDDALRVSRQTQRELRVELRQAYHERQRLRQELNEMRYQQQIQQQAAMQQEGQESSELDPSRDKTEKIQRSQLDRQQQVQRVPSRIPPVSLELLHHAIQMSDPNIDLNAPCPLLIRNQVPSAPPDPSTVSTSSQSTVPPTRPDMSQQLTQMREIGLTDENVCLQALIATNGDVQAAIELIFSDITQ